MQTPPASVHGPGEPANKAQTLKDKLSENDDQIEVPRTHALACPFTLQQVDLEPHVLTKKKERETLGVGLFCETFALVV